MKKLAIKNWWSYLGLSKCIVAFKPMTHPMCFCRHCWRKEWKEDPKSSLDFFYSSKHCPEEYSLKNDYYKRDDWRQNFRSFLCVFFCKKVPPSFFSYCLYESATTVKNGEALTMFLKIFSYDLVCDDLCLVEVKVGHAIREDIWRHRFQISISPLLSLFFQRHSSHI